MKICTGCKQEKNYTEFYKNKRMKDGYASRCKICDDAGNKATRHKDMAKARSYRTSWKNDLVKRVNEWKSEQGCACCSETTACCLELHHTDPSEKEGHPADLKTSWDRFMTEAAKCIVVCSNCHKKIHAGLLTLGTPQSIITK